MPEPVKISKQKEEKAKPDNEHNMIVKGIYGKRFFY